MNTPAEIRPTEATVSAYEGLRGRLLDPYPRVSGELGLNVLLRQGMLAWTRISLPVPGTAQTTAMPLDTARVPDPLQVDVIDVMVNMVTSVSRSVQPGAHHP